MNAIRVLHILAKWSIIFVVAGCQVLNAPDVPSTLEAQNTAFKAEATRMAESLVQGEVNLLLTAQAASTTIAELSNINRQMAATAQVVIPPTPARQVSIAPGAEGVPGSEGVSGSEGSSPFVDTGVTTNKRDSDGCADGFQNEFTSDTPRIYAITRATHVNAGTVVSVEWMNASQMAGEGSYTVTEEQSNFCIWFPYDGPFAPGEWTVQFSVNGQPIQPIIAFTIGGV